MNFKVNFLLWMLVEFLWFIGQLVLIEVLFQYVQTIGGWSKWEVVLLIGTHQMIGQLFQSVFFVNLANLPELVRTGRLDLMLLLPVDTQFAASTRQFGWDNVVNALVGAGFVLFSLNRLHLWPGAFQWVLYFTGIGAGIAIHYAVLFSLATCSFWIVRAQGLIHGYYHLFQIGRYPDTVFTGFIHFAFTWILPVILVANAPARVLVKFQEHSLHYLVVLILSALMTTVVSRMFWKFGLRHYSSASS